MEALFDMTNATPFETLLDANNSLQTKPKDSAQTIRLAAKLLCGVALAAPAFPTPVLCSTYSGTGRLCMQQKHGAYSCTRT